MVQDFPLTMQLCGTMKRTNARFPLGVFDNYLQIKKDVATIVHTEINRMLDTPELTDLIIRKAVV